MSAYKKIVSHRFEAAGYDWNVLEYRQDFICIEELRKNGQEDTHVYAMFAKKEKKWRLYSECDDEQDEGILVYLGRDVADQVAGFFDENGIPE